MPIARNSWIELRIPRPQAIAILKLIEEARKELPSRFAAFAEDGDELKDFLRILEIKLATATIHKRTKTRGRSPFERMRP